MLEGALAAWLQARYGEAWWRSGDAGEALRRSWSRGQKWDAQDVVAHLGYDRLDWRPVLRQIRTRLIGEMSGYGGPNITTRAGTRKV
jgi:Neuraminidase (sialidase)